MPRYPPCCLHSLPLKSRSLLTAADILTDRSLAHRHSDAVPNQKVGRKDGVVVMELITNSSPVNAR